MSYEFAKRPFSGAQQRPSVAVKKAPSECSTDSYCRPGKVESSESINKATTQKAYGARK